MAIRSLSLFERVCEAVYDFNARGAERYHGYLPGRYPGGLFAMPVGYHAITQGSPIVAGPNDPARLAADREVLRARAAQSRQQRPATTVTTLAILFSAAVLVFMVVIVLVGTSEDRDFTALAVLLPLMGGVGAYFLAGSIGWRACLVHAMQQWAERLGGDCGVDDLHPVVAWFEQFWPWFSPPHFLSRETRWALGWHGGLPVLLVAERDDRRIFAATAAAVERSLETGREHLPEYPTSILCRLSLFLAGGALRSDAAAQAAVHELVSWGYGVVRTPAGLYVYGLAYERALKPQYLSTVIERLFSAMALPDTQTPGAKKG